MFFGRWESDFNLSLVNVLNIKTSIKRTLISYNEKQSPDMFCERDALKNFAKLTWKHLRWRLFLRCFSVNFAKFLEHIFNRTPQDDCLCIINAGLSRVQIFTYLNIRMLRIFASHIFYVDLYYNQIWYSILMIIYIDILKPVVIL